MRRECWTSELRIAKSISISDTERRSGGCALKADELTSGDLCCVLGKRTERAVRSVSATQKSAEGIVGEESKP
jgi:hypothetical protein